MTRGRAALVAFASCFHPMLVQPSAPADAEPVPGGTAAPDELYLASDAGIDAVDPDTGAVRWHTAAASVPVLALPTAVLAFAAARAGDGWTGPAQLVAIDRAPPHAARTGPLFDLDPGLARRRLLDARVVSGALDVWWFAEPEPRDFLTQVPPPADGAIQLDLAAGAVLGRGPGWAPDAVRAALAGITVWSAVGTGLLPWRAGDGWSIVALMPEPGGSAEPSLRHWPARGADTTVALLAPRHLGWAQVEHANRHHVFLRVCEPVTPPDCELRIVDGVTGAVVATTPSPPPPADRLEPPYALRGRLLLATRRTAMGREVVAFDLDHGERWRRPLPSP